MTDDRGIFEHWFFKDIVDEQRLSLIRLFLGDAVAKEVGPVHGHQRRCLKSILGRLATLQRQDERVRELEAMADALGTGFDDNVKFALNQRMCCDGQMCGCRGSTVGEYLEHHLRATLKDTIHE